MVWLDLYSLTIITWNLKVWMIKIRLYGHHELWHFGQATHNFICIKKTKSSGIWMCNTFRIYIFFFLWGSYFISFFIFVSFGPLIILLGHSLFSFFNMENICRNEKVCTIYIYIYIFLTESVAIFYSKKEEKLHVYMLDGL